MNLVTVYCGQCHRTVGRVHQGDGEYVWNGGSLEGGKYVWNRGSLEGVEFLRVTCETRDDDGRLIIPTAELVAAADQAATSKPTKMVARLLEPAEMTGRPSLVVLTPKR